MPRTTVYIISDDAEVVEKTKNSLTPMGVTVATYSTYQWREGLENSLFRNQLTSGLPALASGNNPLQNPELRNNVLPFPGVQNGSTDSGRVSTMNELESNLDKPNA